MNTLQKLEESIVRSTGKDINYLRNTPICEIRKDVEREKGQPMQVTGVSIETVYVFGSSVKIVAENYQQ